MRRMLSHLYLLDLKNEIIFQFLPILHFKTIPSHDVRALTHTHTYLNTCVR